MTRREITEKLGIKDFVFDICIKAFGKEGSKGDDYDAAFIDKLRQAALLNQIGLSDTEIIDFYAYEKCRSYDKQIALVRKNRAKVLDEIHRYERFIEYCDWIVDTLEKQKKGEKLSN